MNFGEIIERSRGRGRQALLEAIRGRRSSGAEVIAEPAPRNSAGEIVAAPDGLMLPLRYDLVYREHGGSFQTANGDTTSIGFSEPVFATWEGALRIEIRSLSWDYLQVRCTTGAHAPDSEPLRSWFLKWFDDLETSLPDEDGLSGVVHFISDPTHEDRGFTFFVDLGSAGSDALAELFDTLIMMGFTHCVLGTTPQPE